MRFEVLIYTLLNETKCYNLNDEWLLKSSLYTQKNLSKLLKWTKLLTDKQWIKFDTLVPTASFWGRLFHPHIFDMMYSMSGLGKKDKIKSYIKHLMYIHVLIL